MFKRPLLYSNTIARTRQAAQYVLFIAETEEWLHGFFDHDSFDEILHGWANTVVVGRARLGGVPVGVVAVETRTVEVDVPADPADMESDEKMLHRAGQVILVLLC